MHSIFVWAKSHWTLILIVEFLFLDLKIAVIEDPRMCHDCVHDWAALWLHLNHILDQQLGSFGNLKCKM